MIITSFCRFVERRKDNYRVSINNRIVEVTWWMALKPVGSILLDLELPIFLIWLVEGWFCSYPSDYF
nr:hypothetical protein CFP56_35128 [Quercus suber]